MFADLLHHGGDYEDLTREVRAQLRSLRVHLLIPGISRCLQRRDPQTSVNVSTQAILVAGSEPASSVNSLLLSPSKTLDIEEVADDLCWSLFSMLKV